MICRTSRGLPSSNVGISRSLECGTDASHEQGLNAGKGALGGVEQEETSVRGVSGVVEVALIMTVRCFLVQIFLVVACFDNSAETT